ncbi:uncharacterized protein [Typha angustifolia]|uniref:uncharacterized protein n=1 Tax=Typha angustifolia TaxID=59011 RepID=UPI003C2D983F
MNASSSDPPKRLLFDRRYGWIFDEWKDPSEEALAGGRGMFCVLPIAKSLLKFVSLTAPHADQCTWLKEIKHSALTADLQLITCGASMLNTIQAKLRSP